MDHNVFQFATVEIDNAYPTNKLYLNAKIPPCEPRRYELKLNTYAFPTTHDLHDAIRPVSILIPAGTGLSSGRKACEITIPLKADTDEDATCESMQIIRDVFQEILTNLKELKKTLVENHVWQDETELKQRIDDVNITDDPWCPTWTSVITTFKFYCRNFPALIALREPFEIAFAVCSKCTGRTLQLTTLLPMNACDIFQSIDCLIETLSSLIKNEAITEMADERMTDPQEQAYLDLLYSCLVN